MSALILSTISNVVLGILVLSYYIPRVKEVYKRKKKLRETKAYEERQKEIRKVVEEVLKDILND